MNECSKATKRRKLDPRFRDRWFIGRGLDVGCGFDPLRIEDWPKVTEITKYDKIYGHSDGQTLIEIKDGSYDFVHSSHSLEHFDDPYKAMKSWLRVLKPGGFVICTVPDEYLYEYGQWPSRFNSDHKNSFTLRADPAIKRSIDLLEFILQFPIDLEHLSLLSHGWSPAFAGSDQTLRQDVECAIEFVLRKPNTSHI